MRILIENDFLRFLPYKDLRMMFESFKSENIENDFLRFIPYKDLRMMYKMQ
jgi:hypothetical protein